MSPQQNITGTWRESDSEALMGAEAGFHHHHRLGQQVLCCHIWTQLQSCTWVYQRSLMLGYCKSMVSTSLPIKKKQWHPLPSAPRANKLQRQTIDGDGSALLEARSRHGAKKLFQNVNTKVCVRLSGRGYFSRTPGKEKQDDMGFLGSGTLNLHDVCFYLIGPEILIDLAFTGWHLTGESSSLPLMCVIELLLCQLTSCPIIV